MSKCKYSKDCKLYNKLSPTCNDNGGMYYNDLTVGAGCFRDREEKNEK